MIIHSAPDYRIYFGDAKDRMFPDQYKNWNDFSLLSREPIVSLAERLSLRALFFLKQTHSSQGYFVCQSVLQQVPPFLKEGDFLVTQESRLGIGVMSADCLPVIVYDKKRHAVGIAHTGWRGAVAGVVPEMVNQLKLVYACDPKDITVFFGPSAKRCCYQVDSNFSEQLEAYPLHDQLLQKQGDSLFFDLPLLVEQQLTLLGVASQSIRKEYNACTICDTRFHSHRRGSSLGSGNPVGRQMTVVALK